MLSGESLSSSLSILRGRRRHSRAGAGQAAGVTPPPQGRGSPRPAAHLTSSVWLCGGVGRAASRSRLFTSTADVSARGRDECHRGWGSPKAAGVGACHPAPSRLTFLAMGLAGRVGVLGLLAQLLGGRDAVHHLLLHGGGRRGGQRGGRRGWVAEVVLGRGTAGREHAVAPQGPQIRAGDTAAASPPHLGEQLGVVVGHAVQHGAAEGAPQLALAVDGAAAEGREEAEVGRDGRLRQRQQRELLGAER